MRNKNEIKNDLRRILDPIVKTLARSGATPMGVSIVGLVASFVAAVFISRGSFRAGAGAMIVGGLCDVLDGMLARYLDRVSNFGAFMDSTLDRVAELAVLGGLIVYFAGGIFALHAESRTFMGFTAPSGMRLVIVLVALGGSFLTSYTRARAEGLGLECKVGIAERPERVAVLAVGLLASGIWLDAAIAILAVLSTITAIQRITYVRRIAGGGADR